MDSTASTPGSGGRPYRTELSPVSFLRRSAYVFPDKVAVVHGERRTTYREFDERVNRLASALADAGVEPGDRVAFLAPNIPAMLEAHYGVPAAGAVLVAINTRHRDCLRRARESCDRAEPTLGRNSELAAVDLHAALHAVIEVVGAASDDAIPDCVLPQFCHRKSKYFT